MAGDLVDWYFVNVAAGFGLASLIYITAGMLGYSLSLGALVALTGIFMLLVAAARLGGLPSADHLEPGDLGVEAGDGEDGAIELTIDPEKTEELMEEFWAELKKVLHRYRDKPLTGVVVVAVDDFGQVSAHWWGHGDPGFAGPLVLGMEKIKAQILERSFDMVLARTEPEDEE